MNDLWKDCHLLFRFKECKTLGSNGINVQSNKVLQYFAIESGMLQSYA